MSAGTAARPGVSKLLTRGERNCPKTEQYEPGQKQIDGAVV